MTMKKIMAGVLAVASVLSVSATAFAAPEAPDKTKEITKPAETEYEAGVGMMGAELSVELPGSMTAFINPYGAVVNVDAAATPTTSGAGIVSWAYEVVNNTEDFGIMIDVKNAKATPAATVAIDAPGAAEAANVKTASLVLQAGDTAAAATTYDNTITATAQATATTQGTFVFDTTEASKSKIAYAPAKTGTTAGKVYLGLTGAISKVDAAGEDLEWTEDDTIAAAYTLKINPSAKTQAAAFAAGGGAGGGFTADVAAGDIGGVSGAWALGALTANNTYAMTYDGNTGGNCTPTFTGYSITSATSSDTSKLTVNASGRMTGVADGTVTVTYVLENDTDNTDTPTIKFEVTLSNC